MKQRMWGFTLVELSLVLLALGLVLPGAVIFWQLSERNRVRLVQLDVQKQSRDALVGFLHSHYRLPCPAVNALGVEDCAATRQVGYFPWRTVGLPRPEAGTLRYGVDRGPSAAGITLAPKDQDLAVARDRMDPMRVRIPHLIPQNADAPNPNAPPIPNVTTGLLGITQSGDAAAPLNADCDASDEPPCQLGVEKAVNLLDICLALNTASDALVAPATRLATQVGGARRPAAFVIAAPGMLDAEGGGQLFDAANASVTDANPTFEAPGRAVTDAYDDVVMAASHTELFAELHCGAALSAVSHAHFNVATGAALLERAMYDYRDQLYISVVLAEAGVAASAAGVLSAAAGAFDATKEVQSAVADAVASIGARVGQVVMAAVGAGLAVVSAATAITAGVDAASSLEEAKAVHSDFAKRTTAMTNLSRSIAVNTLTADAIGH